tara:strand:+ start:178 stop:1512 length:1335 start_codon:yes stop_codon:yes gene_type:complete
MLPGYRKKTKFVPTVRDSTGFVTINNVVDIIKDMTSAEEFYEIEPAEVVKVWLDPEDPDFPTNTNTEGAIFSDMTMLGAITVRLLHSQRSGGTLDRLVMPLSPHIVQYPLKGEVVNVADYNGQLYYSNPLNLSGKVNMNRLPFKLGERKVFEALTKYNRKVHAEQGDTVIQGRFGQSLHFGSDVNYVKPYMKLTVGQHQSKASMVAKEAIPGFPHLSEINLDEASIWMTTNQHLPLKTAAPSNMKGAKLGGVFHSLIALNSDSIVFNAKKKGGDVSAFAARNINLCAQTSINLESEYGVINLGDVIGQNPAVKGKELVEFFETLLGELENYAGSVAAMLKSQYAVGMKEDEGAKLQVNNFTNAFTEALDKLDSKLQGSATFFSKRVFLANDHNPPDMSAKGTDNRLTGDEESLWDDNKWEEIGDIADEEIQEVDNITQTGGVRG